MKNLIKYAELFKLISDNFSGASLGKKVSQKMFYFFERSGIELNLRYGIHYYGPYSSRLDNYMHMLENENFINIDTSKSTHVISIENFTNEIEVLLDDEVEKAQFVIRNFAQKTPLQLEALATMDYVANYILSSNPSKEDVIDKFKEIKGDKFSQEDMDNSYRMLKEIKFIA